MEHHRRGHVAVSLHGARHADDRLCGTRQCQGGEVYSKYVITDMFAKAVQGMRAEDAVKWAEGELKKIYEA